jgi:prepilin-type processing-associated H-X9-DG protein
MFTCPSAAGSAESRVYDGGIPAGAIPGLPALTWRAAPSDYCVSTGVRGVFANLAYRGNAGGRRHGTLQDHITVVGVARGTNRDGKIAAILDGTSNTFMLGERTGGNDIYTLRKQLIAANGGGWGDPLNGEHWLTGTLYSGLPFPPQEGPCGINCTNLRGYGFHSFHPGGCHFAMADGSTQFINQIVDPHVIARQITREKSEIPLDY